MATASYYTDLITSYWRGKPRFTATVNVSAEAGVELIDLAQAMPEDFDLDTAIGAQLDVIGEWVGRSRYIATPIDTAWFSWGTPGLGWAQGVWKGPFDSETGLNRLNDDTYRLLIRAKISANNWDGTMETAPDALAFIFVGSDTIVYIEDKQDMSMIIGIAGVIPDALVLSILTGGYIPLKPAGVFVNYVVTSVSGAPVFGWGAAGAPGRPLAGWGTGTWGVTPEYALTHDLIP